MCASPFCFSQTAMMGRRLSPRITQIIPSLGIILTAEAGRRHEEELESGKRQSRKKAEAGGGGSSGSRLIPLLKTRLRGSVRIILKDGITRIKAAIFVSLFLPFFFCWKDLEPRISRMVRIKCSLIRAIRGQNQKVAAKPPHVIRVIRGLFFTVNHGKTRLSGVPRWRARCESAASHLSWRWIPV